MHFAGTLRVCQQCRLRPLTPTATFPCSSEKAPAPAPKYLLRPDTAPPQDDSLDAILADYAHTVTHPMRFSRERWQALFRVAVLCEKNTPGFTNIVTAAQSVKPLALPRPRISEAYKILRDLGQDATARVRVWHATPAQFQLG